MRARVLNHVIDCVNDGDMKKEYIFDSTVFYYLCGYEPKLTLNQAISIVNELREMVIKNMI